MNYKDIANLPKISQRDLDTIHRANEVHRAMGRLNLDEARSATSLVAANELRRMREQLGFDSLKKSIAMQLELHHGGLASIAKSIAEDLTRGITFDPDPILAVRQSMLISLGSAAGSTISSISKETARIASALASTLGQNEKLFREADLRLKPALQNTLIIENESTISSLRETVAALAASTYSTIGQSMLTQIKNEEFLREISYTAIRQQTFAAETFSKFNNANAIEASVLRASLNLFSDQTTRSAAALFKLSEGHPLRHRRIEVTPISFFAPEIQTEELASNADQIQESQTYADLAPLAPTSSIVDLAISCIELIERCNESSMLKGEESPFKPTTRSMVAAAKLPQMIARNRDSFASVVDYLYFLIYEGTGEAKRIISAGYMSRDECTTLWDLKHLRSKLLRHDIEHGSTKDIMSKYRFVAEALQRLKSNGIPRTAEEWAALHRNLLLAINAFLTEVAQRIEGRTS